MKGGIRLSSRTLVIAIVGAKETSLLFFFLRPSSLLSPVKTAISRLREEEQGGGGQSAEVKPKLSVPRNEQKCTLKQQYLKHNRLFH